MLPEGVESPEKITYQAASPDEAALVTAAKNFGFFFYRFWTILFCFFFHIDLCNPLSFFFWSLFVSCRSERIWLIELIHLVYTLCVFNEKYLLNSFHQGTLWVCFCPWLLAWGCDINPLRIDGLCCDWGFILVIDNNFEFWLIAFWSIKWNSINLNVVSKFCFCFYSCFITDPKR